MMKFKLKVLVAAVALAASGVSQAAFTNVTGASGTSLIFEAWNDTAGTGFVQNLSAQGGGYGSDWFATFVTNGAPQSFQLNAAFYNNSAFSSGNFQWHVYSVDPYFTLNTTQLGSAIPVQLLTTLGTIFGATQTHINDINSALGGADFGTFDSAAIAYPGINGGNYYNNLFGVDSAISGFGMSGYHGTYYDGGSLIDANVWSLTSTGMLTFAAAPAEVPLPAAAWLFGSGLLGLVGVARRRKNEG